jgi:hypothetical protein
MPMAAPTPVSDSTSVRRPGPASAPAQPARPAPSARLPACALDTGEAANPRVPAAARAAVASTPTAGRYSMANPPASSGPTTNSSSSSTASRA